MFDFLPDFSTFDLELDCRKFSRHSRYLNYKITYLTKTSFKIPDQRKMTITMIMTMTIITRHHHQNQKQLQKQKHRKK